RGWPCAYPKELNEMAIYGVNPGRGVRPPRVEAVPHDMRPQQPSIHGVKSLWVEAMRPQQPSTPKTPKPKTPAKTRPPVDPFAPLTPQQIQQQVQRFTKGYGTPQTSAQIQTSAQGMLDPIVAAITKNIGAQTEQATTNIRGNAAG